MNYTLRIVIAAIVFYIVYLLLQSVVSIVEYPLPFLISIFLIYLFFPDISNKDSIIHKQLEIISWILLIFGVIMLLVNRFWYIGALILLGTLLINIFSDDEKIISSLLTGLLISLPLALINIVYAITAFFGFFSFWVTNKIF